MSLLHGTMCCAGDIYVMETNSIRKYDIITGKVRLPCHMNTAGNHLQQQ